MYVGVLTHIWPPSPLQILSAHLRKNGWGQPINLHMQYTHEIYIYIYTFDLDGWIDRYRHIVTQYIYIYIYTGIYNYKFIFEYCQRLFDILSKPFSREDAFPVVSSQTVESVEKGLCHCRCKGLGPVIRVVFVSLVLFCGDHLGSSLSFIGPT